MRYQIDIAWWRFIHWMAYLPFVDGGGRVWAYYTYLCHTLDSRHDKFNAVWLTSIFAQMNKYSK